MQNFNHFLDRLSEFLSKRKGLIPLLGILLVALNFVLRLVPGVGWLAESDLFLHLGVIVGILSFMIAWAL
ncbi:MAG: hypothetical protein FJ010_13500 [Chloroflexi bacterium]|nr:hypothetical protein [Chloroflexota bacterium]